MNQEKRIICKHELNKVMRQYEAISNEPQTLMQLVKMNSEAIYLLTEIVLQMLMDEE